MIGNTAMPPDAASDALLAAALFAIDPSGLGGIAVRAGAGPVRDRWLEAVRAFLPAAAPWRRLPVHITDERLLGGLDLGATLAAGRTVGQRGVLAEADGGAIVIAMAERLPAATAARIAAVMDRGEVAAERDGLTMRHNSRVGIIALDEGERDEASPPAALTDRLAFHVDLGGLRVADLPDPSDGVDEIASARANLSRVTIGDDVIEAICGVALALGIPSLRAAMLAVHAARVHAAFEGRDAVEKPDAEAAARLVLGPRATQLPASESEAEEAPPEPPPPDESETSEADDKQEKLEDLPLEDMVLAAAQAAIPAGLLALIELGKAGRGQSQTSGKSGASKVSRLRGRPIGATRGDPRSGVRLSVIDTLRAAAPWQGIRARERPSPVARLEIRRDDFRIKRFKHRNETTTIFVVDASGSSALHRLAEAKGAVELLLADCYVRRDTVAMIAFRGKEAELLLPPTRSLARAKRSLAGLPGGGGTPLAAAIDASLLLAQSVARRDATPVVVFLTDGRANVCRDGSGGRGKAEEEALAAARMLRACAINVILVDTSPAASLVAQKLAGELGAKYLALPYADARLISKAVQIAQAAP